MTTTDIKIKAQHDSAWKDVLDAYLPQAFVLCFPDLYTLIDWHREWIPLDKELQSITKATQTGVRYVDKLIRCYLKNGQEQWILVHIEIQQENEPTFTERMFLYGFRLYDKYRHPIASCAILTDANANFRPTYHEVGVANSRLRLDFMLCKLIDFSKDRSALEHSTNPFATVILFHLDALVAKKQNEQGRFETKLALTRRLYESGFQKQEIINLFRFLDFSIALPSVLEVKYQEVIHEIEAKKNMSYVTSIERLGIQKGIQQGIQQGMQQGIQQGLLQGEHALLIRMLKRKFSTVPEQYLQLIDTADEATLLEWAEKLIDAQTLHDIFEKSDI